MNPIHDSSTSDAHCIQVSMSSHGTTTGSSKNYPRSYPNTLQFQLQAHRHLSSKVRVLYERTLDFMDDIGLFFTSKRRILFHTILFIYYVIQLGVTADMSAIITNVHSYDPNRTIRQTIIAIDTFEFIISLICLIIYLCDSYIMEKFFLVVETLLVSLHVGWLCIWFIDGLDGITLAIFNWLIVLFLATIDISIQRIRSTSTKPVNFHQFYKLRNQMSRNSTLMSFSSLDHRSNAATHMKHDFQAVSPTIDDEDSGNIVRVEVNDSIKDFVANPTDSIADISNEDDESEKIEYDGGFRVKLDSLSKSSTLTVDNVSWDSFSSIEHRIDSSSCHIYTAIFQDTPVIVKLIKADRLKSQMSLFEFEMEASILRRIRHPNIVRLLGTGSSPRPFLVLELLDGGSLSHALGIRPDAYKRYVKKKFSYIQSLHMARSIALAMDYLHNRWNRSCHIIHRDLKPDNIGWTSDGTLKIFDFGLCTCVKTSEDCNESYRLTGNTGTLRYMAPEVALGRPYNKSVDVYSFGVIFWQILSGSMPFKSMSKKGYMEKVVVGGQRPKVDVNWSPRLKTLLESCWLEDKNQRPDFSVILDELNALIQEEDEVDAKFGLKQLLLRCYYYWSLCSKAFVRIRLFVLLIASIFFIVSVCLLEYGNHHRHLDSIIVAGTTLCIISSSGMYAIFMIQLRGSSLSLSNPKVLSSRNVILGLELSSKRSRSTEEEALYGL